jgi:hypothetical protein
MTIGMPAPDKRQITHGSGLSNPRLGPGTSSSISAIVELNGNRYLDEAPGRQATLAYRRLREQEAYSVISDNRQNGTERARPNVANSTEYYGTSITIDVGEVNELRLMYVHLTRTIYTSSTGANSFEDRHRHPCPRRALRCKGV